MARCKIAGRVRGWNAYTSFENREDEQTNILVTGDAIVGEGLPNRAEIVRLGDSWQMMSAAATSLTAVPTTAGLLTLWNGEPGNGKIYLIDSVAVTKVVLDVTTYDQFTLWGQIIRPPMTAPTDAALARVSLCGKTNYSGRARNVASSTTLANRWDNLGTNPGQVAAIAGSTWAQMDVDVLGKYIVQPTSAFTLTVSSTTAEASQFRLVIRWHEVQISYVG